MTDKPMHSKAIEALAVALWERDPDMSAPSDALEKAESIILALHDSGFALVPVASLDEALKAPMIDHSGRKTGVYDLIRLLAARPNVKG